MFRYLTYVTGPEGTSDDLTMTFPARPVDVLQGEVLSPVEEGPAPLHSSTIPPSFTHITVYTNSTQVTVIIVTATPLHHRSHNIWITVPYKHHTDYSDISNNTNQSSFSQIRMDPRMYKRQAEYNDNSNNNTTSHNIHTTFTKTPHRL